MQQGILALATEYFVLEYCHFGDEILPIKLYVYSLARCFGRDQWGKNKKNGIRQ